MVEAAIGTIDEIGYERLTIRAVAERLGVAPMTLYRHIESKDDLLDEVADRQLAQFWRPRAKREDWQAWISEACRLLRNLLVSQPAVLHVYLRHPVVSPAAVRRMEAMLAVLSQAGLDDAAARRAYASIHTYTVGFAALEASRRRGGDAAWQPGSVQAQLAAFTTPGQFANGLGHLLAGIERERRGGGR